MNKILLDWFEKNLPKDSYLQQDIFTRMGKIYSKIKVSPETQINIPITFTFTNSRDTPSRLTMDSNALSIIFVGVLAKAILDSLTAEFEGLLSSEIGSKVLDKKVREVVDEYNIPQKEEKECHKCNTKNILRAKHCLECGEPFT